MLSELFTSSARVRAVRDGLGSFSPWLEGFAEHLLRCGYSKLSVRRHLRSAEHLARWAIRQGLPPDTLDTAALERFGDHLPRCRCGRYGREDRSSVVVGARHFVEHLRGIDHPDIRIGGTVAPEPDLLIAFCEWMREQRGTTDATLYNYGLPIRALIERLGEDPGKLDARCLREFVLERSQHTGWAATKQCTTALRMFLRFLVADGRCRAGLLGAIPVVAHWRLAAMPACLSPDDVERLIASCDLSLPVGLRDRAILLLLARLGLRAGDIVQLRLHDIDWRGAWIHVCGKGRQQVRLPLSQEVGQAIVAYLQEGRPPACADAVFLRSRAPIRALGSHCAVSMIVDKTLRRAGVGRPARGAAHLLRHSAASSMLRQGASLQDIALLLRHRSVETTQIYAKVDVRALTQIAQPWVEATSC